VESSGDLARPHIPDPDNSVLGIDGQEAAVSGKDKVGMSSGEVHGQREVAETQPTRAWSKVGPSRPMRPLREYDRPEIRQPLTQEMQPTAGMAIIATVTVTITIRSSSSNASSVPQPNYPPKSHAEASNRPSGEKARQ
jgi:hypothetical protein